MIDHAAFFSRTVRRLRGSAIRRAGDLAARTADLVSFAPGFPDSSMFAWDEFRDIAASVLSGSDPSVLQYGQTQGYRRLLEVLPEVLADRGITATPAETIVTTGSQQALDLSARVFIDPGDVVIVELPTYTGAIAAFDNAQARLVGVDQDREGIDLGALDEVVVRERAAGRRVAFCYVIPNFQNPTGTLTTLGRRAALLEWARRRDVLIVEDDPYGALYFDDVATAADTRPIKADDDEGRVVYLSSFSKTVAPGLRVAWVTADAEIVSRFEVVKQSADLCTSALDQRLIYEMWTRGVLARRLPALRACYQRKRTLMEQALRRELGPLVSWNEPKGGFFLWATFADLDTEVLLTRAIDHGVVYVPGSAFYVERADTRHGRLAFSGSSIEQIDAGVRRLASAVQEEREALRPA